MPLNKSESVKNLCTKTSLRHHMYIPNRKLQSHFFGTGSRSEEKKWFDPGPSLLSNGRGITNKNEVKIHFHA
jgi:hypothetical protein